MLLLSLGEIRMSGCGAHRWCEFEGGSFARCGVCSCWHSQEFNTWVVLSQVTGRTGNSPEAAQEALSLFENQEQLGQAIQWYRSELQKLEQKERE